MVEAVLTQILTELKDIKTGQENLVGRMDNLESGQEELQGRLSNLEIGQEELRKGQVDLWQYVETLHLDQTRMEKTLVEKIDALFDDRDLQNNRFTNLEKAVERIEAKVDVLQLETALLKRIK